MENWGGPSTSGRRAYIDGTGKPGTDQTACRCAPASSEVRAVALDLATVAALKAHRKAQTQERLKAGQDWQDSGLVFVWEDGSRVLPDFLSKLFVKQQAGLDLPRLVLHGTRHSHACTLLRAGVPVHVVAARLGHADPLVTLRVYSHAIPADGAAAAAVFGSAVGAI